MYMVQHMATTLMGGRARACGWNWKGQIKYSIFPKGGNQRTFLPIRARIDSYGGFVLVYTCTYALNQMHKLHAGANQNACISTCTMHGI